VVTPFVELLAEPTSLSATVAGLTRHRPTRSYITLWDVTDEDSVALTDHGGRNRTDGAIKSS
jgi:hypothetical protein